MERFEDGRPLPPEWRGAWAALGSFDGLHRGHQAILADLRRAAAAAGRRALLVGFEPHPRRFFQPDAPPFRLTTPDERAALLAAGQTVDGLVAIPFDAALAAMPADAFIADWLVDRLGLAGLIVGPDFRFGRGRQGDVALLQADARFATIVHPPVLSPEGRRYSSTDVRAALADGDCHAAAGLLGRPHAITEIVVEGDRRGRLLGFPTANLRLGDRLVPRMGVYAGHASLPDGTRRACVSNLGVRPSFDAVEPRLESHLIDFDGDLYGRPLTVTLEHFIRPERRFESLDALKAQIAADRDRALQWHLSTVQE